MDEDSSSPIKHGEKGPSTASTSNLLTLNDNKAGMVGLDKERINQIILEASKDSPFYKRQLEKQERIDAEIREKVALMNTFSAEQILRATEVMNMKAEYLEAERRNLTRIIVHIDLDMFYAAVEIRDDPSLAGKPVAVGSNSMISTSNYIARKFGVRAGMAGFIGKKLCKDLVIINPDFEKYKSASKDVMQVISEYDPNLQTASLDEAYFDLTGYVYKLYEDMQIEDHSLEPITSNSSSLPEGVWQLAFNVVNEIRTKIAEKTKLTASAGIAHNTMFAKICSDMNKPNGQYMMDSTSLEKVDEFLSKIPVRKIPGIGPVTEQHLRGLGIVTCHDLKEKRGLISLLFTPASVDFYLRVSIGLSSNFVSRDEDYVRKSLGAETTFQATDDMKILVDHLSNLSHEVSEDLKKRDLFGKRITLRIKWASFVAINRNKSLQDATNDADIIFNTVKSSLESEMKLKIAAKESPLIRLVGVRVSNFVEEGPSTSKKTKKQSRIDDFIFRSPKKEQGHSPKKKVLEYLCVECLQEFETESDLEIHVENDCRESLQEEPIRVSTFSATNSKLVVACPVCNNVFNGLDSLNSHLDSVCLRAST